MIVATHQPLFLPWPGFFFKAMRADCMVLLDSVQFPRGRSWMTRNRLKSAPGELWLSVPVHRKGRRLQTIGEVRLFGQKNWQRKHLTSIRQWYANAPYLEEYLPTVQKIYATDDDRLLSLNLRFIRLLWEALRIDTQLILQSETGIVGQRTDLIIRICEHLGARRYVTFAMASKYLDSAQMMQAGIQLETVPFRPPVYPQLWGDFIPNLSALDLVLNCGPASSRVLSRA